MCPKYLRPLTDLVVCVLAFCCFSGCGVNKIPTLDEQVKAAWSQVLNQYQRRADLIPNLVETVKGLRASGAAGFDSSGRGARESDPDAVAA